MFGKKDKPSSDSNPQFSNLQILLRHRIIPVWPPGVALPNAFHAQPNAFKNAPFLNGFHHVVGAGWLKAAFGPQQRRNGHLVEPNGQDEYFFYPTGHDKI